MTSFIVPSLRLERGSSKATSAHQGTAKPSSKTRSSSIVVEPLSRVIKGFGNLVLSFRDGLSAEEREEQRTVEERKQILAAVVQSAETYERWEAAAHELDVLEGNEEWKADVSSSDYNADLIRSRMEALNEARTSGDLRSMLHLVRTALSRDLGGMGNIDLYRHSYCGTKKLIEQYVDATLQTIASLVAYSSQALPADLEHKDLLEGVLFARQSFGRSALLLSGGGTFGMAHIGVLKAMFEIGLLPRIISGASAGSIVCAVACARTDDQMPKMLEEFPYGDLAVFDELGKELGVLDHVRRMLTEGSWSDIKHLTRVMRNLLGDITFQEAYNRTRRICNICVSSPSIYEVTRILNYVTAPNVLMWSAVAASCSVPVIFTAASLLAKDPVTGQHVPWNPTPQTWIDGSVDNDLPMTRLAEMFNVNHFIVSQVNPHVVPFLSKEKVTPTPGTKSEMPGDADFTSTITQLAKGEALHRLHFMAEMGIFPNMATKLQSILSQKYSGDINIIPALGLLDLPGILSNPSVEFMLRSCLMGEQATWPKVSRIRDRCAIELALDRAVQDLRARVVFSKSQVDLRRLATGSLTGTLSSRFRGSHEPLNAMEVDTGAGSPAKEKLNKHRQRRLSVGHLQPLPHHRRLVDDPYKITDGDTDDEERLEMRVRHPHQKTKLRIKRPVRSNPYQGGALTTTVLPVPHEPDMFDFSRPLEDSEAKNIDLDQTVQRPSLLRQSAAAKHHTDDALTAGATDTASMTSPAEFGATTNDIETSDLHSSDGDIDSITDQSGEGNLVEASDHESEAMESLRQNEIKGDSVLASAQEDLNYVDSLDPGAGLWS